MMHIFQGTWQCKGESGTVFTDVTIDMADGWTDYDEKVRQTSRIFCHRAQILR
jgi:hypothetical protein